MHEVDQTRPVLVGVHGWLLSSRLWGPLSRELSPHWSLLGLDLPGFGKRPRPRGLAPNLASYGRWLAETLRQELGDQPIILVGHSLGGSVVLHAADLLDGQIVGLIQIAAGGGVYQPRPFAQLRKGGAAFLRWRPSWLSFWPGTQSIRTPLQADLRAAQGLLVCSTSRGAVKQLPRLTAELKVPNLWIAGGRDQVMAARYVCHLAGYSHLHQVKVMHQAGHLPMCQMPRLLAVAMQDWLEEVITPAQ